MQLGQEFVAVSERIAAKEAKLSPDYDPQNAERRRSTVFAINQLSEETVQLIGQQYTQRDERGQHVMSVKAIAAEHHIHPATVYELAGKRGWPKREAVQATMQRIAAVTPEVAQAAIDRLNGADSAAASATADPEELEGSADDHPALSDRQNLSRAQVVEQAARDELLESYALACAEVLGIHRDLSRKVLTTGNDLLAVFNAAIADAREEYKANPRACAKVVSQLAKDYHALVGTLQKAIDMQRQAYALDVDAGKGMSTEHMTMMRAMKAGMLPANHLFAALPPPPQGQQQGDAGQNDAAARANPPVVIEGTYEELVRKAEADGVRLQ